jgi:PAS domain-containing protein
MTRRDGILILDAERALVVDANPFLTELLACGREDLLGRSLREIGLFADADPRDALLETALRDGFASCRSLPLRTGDGRRLLVDVVGISYLVNERRVLQLNVSDVTDGAACDRAAAAPGA